MSALNFFKSVQTFPHTRLAHEASDKDKKQIYSMFESAKIFVFDSSFLHQNMSKVNEHIGEVVELRRLSIPFKCTSFECSNSSVTTAIKPEWRLIHLISFEQSPGFLDYFAVIRQNEKAEKYSAVFVPHTNNSSELHQYLTTCLINFTDLLNMESSEGVQKINEKIRVGSGADRRICKIKEIIHIAPKDVSRKEVASPRDIIWSHRTRVRGHWRKVSGIGKDREDKYVVSGFTWVTDHIRYPEHLPLVEKIRHMGPLSGESA